jgi:DNA-binding CsgD family transcriptional regulator
VPRELNDPFMVGRDAEVHQLQSVVRRVGGGEGQLQQIIGEPGIGKSHLMEVVRLYAKDQLINVVSLRATELDSYDPYGMVLRLGELFSLAAPVNTAGPGDLAAFFRRIFTTASATPTIFFFDDFQWWDEQSMHSAVRAFEHAQNLGVGIIVASRPILPALDGSENIAFRALHRMMKSLIIGPLSQEETLLLAEHITGTVIADGLEKSLVRLTSGNPFFVHEVLKTATSINELSTMSPPTEVSRLLDTRIDLLGASELAMALCALCGTSTRQSTLHEAALHCGLDVNHLNAALRRALELGIIAPFHEIIEFRHALYAQQLVMRLSYAQRRDFHSAVAQALASEEMYSQAMKHVSESGSAMNSAVGIPIAQSALEHAVRKGHHSGVKNASSWLLRQEHHTQIEHVELLIHIARAQISIGERIEGRKNALDAFGLARELHNVELEARALIEWSERQDFTPDREPLLEAFEKIELMSLAPDTRVRVMAKYALSVAAVPTKGKISVHPQGETDAVRQKRLGSSSRRLYTNMASRDWESFTSLGRELANNGRREAEANSDGGISNDALLSILLAWHGTHQSPDFLKQRLETSQQAMRLTVVDQHLIYSARYYFIINLWQVGDYAQADAELRVFQAEISEGDNTIAQWWVSFFASARAFSRGELQESQDLATVAYRIGELADEPGRLVVLLEQQILVAMERVIDPELLKFMNKEIPLIGNVYARSSAALINASAQNIEYTNLYLESVLEAFEDEDREIGWVTIIANAIEAAHLCGRSEIAQKGVDLLSPYADQHVLFIGNTIKGPVKRYLALAQIAQGECEIAVELLLEAKKESEVAQQSLWALASLVDLLELLAVIDPQRVLQMTCEEELLLAENSEMTWRASRGRKALSLARRSCAAQLGINDRTFDVLEGLARQLTIQEIGDELGFSHSTVRKESMKLYKIFATDGREATIAKARELLLCS